MVAVERWIADWAIGREPTNDDITWKPLALNQREQRLYRRR
ncbi:hypothetical protein ACNKHL_21190 [Shigella flexneri]